jgi:hypothetical protein
MTLCLAYALTFVPNDGSAHIGHLVVPGANPDRALLVIGDVWRVALMSIRNEGEPLTEFTPRQMEHRS